MTPMRRLPADGTLDERGVPLHSWETLLLPYLNFNTETINFKLPWNHPANARNFRCALPVFVNPDFRTVKLYDDHGFGLSHYAANSRVVYANSQVRREDITDGLSLTDPGRRGEHGFRAVGAAGQQLAIRRPGSACGRASSEDRRR